MFDQVNTTVKPESTPRNVHVSRKPGPDTNKKCGILFTIHLCNDLTIVLNWYFK